MGKRKRTEKNAGKGGGKKSRGESVGEERGASEETLMEVEWPAFVKEQREEAVPTLLKLFVECSPAQKDAFLSVPAEEVEAFQRLFETATTKVLVDAAGALNGSSKSNVEESLKLGTAVVDFVVWCLNRLDVPVLRSCVRKLVSFRMWKLVGESQLSSRLSIKDALARQWTSLNDDAEKGDAKGGSKETLALGGFWKSLFQLMFCGKHDGPPRHPFLHASLLAISLFLETPLTRRFAVFFFQSIDLVARFETMSQLDNRSRDLLSRFERALVCGDKKEEATQKELVARVRLLQRVGLRHFDEELRDVVLTPCLQTARDIRQGDGLGMLELDQLEQLCEFLGKGADEKTLLDLPKVAVERRAFLESLIKTSVKSVESYQDVIRKMGKQGAFFPASDQLNGEFEHIQSEAIQLRDRVADNQQAEMKLQYLSEQQFLADICEHLREQEYAVVASDVASALRVLDVQVEDNRVKIGGWSRMALPAMLAGQNGVRCDWNGTPVQVLSEWSALAYSQGTVAIVQLVPGQSAKPRVSCVSMANVKHVDAGSGVFSLTWLRNNFSGPRPAGARYLLVRRNMANDRSRTLGAALLRRAAASAEMQLLPHSLRQLYLGQISAQKADGKVLIAEFEHTSAGALSQLFDAILNGSYSSSLPSSENQQSGVQQQMRRLFVCSTEDWAQKTCEYLENYTALSIARLHRFDLIRRVQAHLNRRAELLEQVDELAQGLGIRQAATSCESAASFYALYVAPELQRYQKLGGDFPFAFFFGGRDNTQTQNKHEVGALENIFTELATHRMFELVQDDELRMDFVLQEHAQVIVATSADVLAALCQSESTVYPLKVDQVVFLQSSRMAHADALASFALLDQDIAKSLVFVGDSVAEVPHGRISCHRSLFARMMRLNCPQLDVKAADDEPRNSSNAAPAFLLADQAARFRLSKSVAHRLETNALWSRSPNPVALTGLARSCQFVDVPEQDETEPVPGEFQNVAQAEYIVSVYQFLVLIGYPAAEITIVTPYQAQKLLIVDILHARCRNVPSPLPFPRLVAVPNELTAGQASDVVLVSLVRSSYAARGADRNQFQTLSTLLYARKALIVFGKAKLYSKHPLWGRVLAQSGSTQLQLLLGQDEHVHKVDEAASDKKKAKKSSSVTHTVDNGSEMSALASHLLWQWSSIQDISTPNDVAADILG